MRLQKWKFVVFSLSGVSFGAAHSLGGAEESGSSGEMMAETKINKSMETATFTFPQLVPEIWDNFSLADFSIFVFPEDAGQS